MNQSGQQIGRFRLLSLLGSGGFATVYRAEDTELGRQVALKLLHPHLAVNAAFVRRFRAEARANARLRHPNIVTIYDVGLAEDDRTYLVMELIEGTPLSQIIDREAPLAVDRVAPIVSQLASALDYMHGAGLAHRDLKPSNVMVAANNVVTLMDFGIARGLDDFTHLTITGEMIGTPAYMAPEQISGGNVGAPADIYALGILTYQSLAGRPPFAGSASEVIDQQRFQPPPPLAALNPAVGREVVRAIERALSKDPRARPASAGQFAVSIADPEATQIQPLASGGAGAGPAGGRYVGRPAAPPLPVPTAPESQKPRPIIPIVATIVLILLVAIGGVLLRRRIAGNGGRQTVVAARAAVSATASPVPSTPKPALVTGFKVCDAASPCKETDFEVRDSFFTCFDLTAGDDPQMITAVATAERADPPSSSGDAGVVARSDAIRQGSGSNCYPINVLSPPLPAGTYSVWLLQSSAVLAHAGFRSTAPVPPAPAAVTEPAPAPAPQAQPAPQPASRQAAPQPIVRQPQPVQPVQPVQPAPQPAPVQSQPAYPPQQAVPPQQQPVPPQQQAVPQQ